MSSGEGQRLVQVALSKIKPDDITHRGFLKPIEIALKTFRTQIMNNNSKIKPNSLPAGLKIAVKAGKDSDKRTLVDIMEINEHERYADLQSNNQDNLLTLMKKAQGIELAICVCMYSEDKKMLKSTIAGISQNIANLVAYENLDPDKIGVFVMMDGIEKVDGTIIDYFEQLEKSCNINLGDNVVPAMTVPEMAKRSQTMTIEEINEEQMKNVNNFLFDAAELEERNSLRFQAVWNDYFEKKKLLQKIKELQKQRPLYDDLPSKLQGFFIDQVRAQRRKDYVESEDIVNMLEINLLLQQYTADLNKMRPLISKALSKGEEYCRNYIQIRQDLAYLSYFRKRVPFQPKHYMKEGSKIRRGSSDYHDETEQILSDEFQIQEPATFMNLFMCVKYKNSGKLSSHNWFFNGFCKELRPKYAILLDVGLRPEAEALLKMYQYMRENQKIGGVCGYMSLKIEKVGDDEEIKDEDVDFLTSIILKFVDIQRTQQVQYHFAHLMDKPFQAAFGFIHVLPGAFSAYNMKAIVKYDEDEDDVLLKNYFKSIDEKLANKKIISSEMGMTNAILRTTLPDAINSCCISIDSESDQAMLYNENVYLAEDRILCMGIHKKGFDMAFLPDAYAEVDPIKTVHGLLGQRKRWINGSYFAFEKVKKELADHENEYGCQFGLNLQILYLSMMNSLSYFAPAFFLFTVHIAMDAFRQDVLSKVLAGVVNDQNNSSQLYNSFVFTIDFIYVLLIMTVVFYSLHLTNNHPRFRRYIYGISTLFGLFMVIVFAVLAVDIFRGLANNSDFLVNNQSTIQSIPGGVSTINLMRWLLIASMLIYAVPILFYICLFGNMHIMCQIILGAFSFLFYTPTYLNILNIYSLCRIDDISWGTKGLDSGSGKNAHLKGGWKLLKFVHVTKYVIWNILLASVLLTLGSSYTARFFVTIGMVILIGMSMSVKVVVGVLYMIYYRCKRLSFSSKKPNASVHSSIAVTIDKYSTEIRDEVANHLNNMKEEYTKNQGGSFIQAKFAKSIVKQAYQKQSNLSSIKQSKRHVFSKAQPALFTIKEEVQKKDRRISAEDLKMGKEPGSKPPMPNTSNLFPPSNKKIEQNSSGLLSHGDHQNSTDNLVYKKTGSRHLAPIHPPPDKEDKVIEDDNFKKRQGSVDKDKFRSKK